jgi:hypothetical protein
MGVNITAEFVGGTRVDDVADAIGILLGLPKLPKQKESLSGNGNGWYVEVKGVKVKASNAVPTMLYIEIDLTRTENEVAAALREQEGDVYQMSYHLESGKLGESHIIPKSSAEKIALARALVGFFGGWIDYNDSDSRAVNFRAPRHPQLHATNGKRWQQFEQSMWDLRPLSKKDVAKVAKWAAYQ